MEEMNIKERIACLRENMRKQKIDVLFFPEDNLYAYAYQYDQYLLDFIKQMPLESQKKRYKEIFKIDFFNS